VRPVERQRGLSHRNEAAGGWSGNEAAGGWSENEAAGGWSGNEAAGGWSGNEAAGGWGHPAARGGHDPVTGFGAAIRDRRRVAGLTQRQLAEAAAVSVAVVRDLEQDRTVRPREASLLRLCTVLDLSPDLPGDTAGPAGDRPPPAPNGTARQAGRPGRGAVRLSVLGPLGAWHGAEPVQLGGPRQRAVLALLTLQPNAVLHRDAIIEALWPADPPASAVKMVQAYVGHLRRQLDPGRAPRDRDGVLVSAGTHYRLRAGADQLDLIAFGQLADRARAARAGDAAAACELFAAALGLWHGEPLADLDLLAGHPAVTGLDRRRAAVVHEFAETAVGAGLHDRVLPHLEALAERDPLDERAHAWLMIALAGTGRQAAALSLYERLRRRLDDQLGVHPGPALAQAHARVLRQDVAAAGPQPRPATRVPAGPARQLPRGPGTFVGRDRAYGALAALARQAAGAAQICVIDGVAGVGKSALAIHAGRRLAHLFPDGQLYADLCGFGPRHPPVAPAEALAGFLRALGVAPAAIPASLDELAAMYRSLLAGRRTLVVLDNAADAAQVRPLLPGAPGTLVLVTSRARLSGLTARDGAARVTLRPLSGAEAIELLGEIVGHRRIAAEQRAAADISAGCGLLPLALRIAADRVAQRPGMELSSLAGQLAAAQARLDVLDLGDEETAVRAVFSWSCRALAPDAARMFRLLGLHRGPDISVPAAGAPPRPAARRRAGRPSSPPRRRGRSGRGRGRRG
jgi:DNA-binding SARP family transcriptional activator